MGGGGGGGERGGGGRERGGEAVLNILESMLKVQTLDPKNIENKILFPYQ